MFNFLKKNQLPDYTIEEISKHNTLDDAWVVIDNNVYNITRFVSAHPGGKIIFKYIGTDATIAFHNFRHSPKAKKLLKNSKLIDYLGILSNKHKSQINLDNSTIKNQSDSLKKDQNNKDYK